MVSKRRFRNLSYACTRSNALRFRVDPEANYVAVAEDTQAIRQKAFWGARISYLALLAKHQEGPTYH